MEHIQKIAESTPLPTAAPVTSPFRGGQTPAPPVQCSPTDPSSPQTARGPPKILFLPEGASVKAELRWIRPKLAEQVLQASHDKLWRLLKEGKIRARRDKHCTWIETDSILEYIESQPAWILEHQREVQTRQARIRAERKGKPLGPRRKRKREDA
jgi:hypothetical protein